MTRPESGFIIEQPSSRREHEALRNLLRAPGLAQPMFERLGLSPLSWLLVELPTSHFGVAGEIDVIGGHLEFQDISRFQKLMDEHQGLRSDCPSSWHSYMAAKQIAEEGGTMWPPSTLYLIGLEVECAYFDGERIRSSKSSRAKVDNIVKQLDRMVDFSIDRVALLDVIANYPANGEGSDAWIAAGERARSSLQRMRSVLAERLPKNHVAGHWVWPVGAVVGGNESRRGAGAPIELRQPAINSKSVSPIRPKFGAFLEGMLATSARPRYFPWILEYCQSCRRIHTLDGCLPREPSC